MGSSYFLFVYLYFMYVFFGTMYNKDKFEIKCSQEGLLERQEVLQWILDLLERLKSTNVEDGLLRLLLNLTLQYLHEFVQSEQLSRRLVNLCARKLSHLVSVAQQQQQQENNSNQPSTPQTPSPCPVPAQTTNQPNGGPAAKCVLN